MGKRGTAAPAFEIAESLADLYGFEVDAALDLLHDLVDAGILRSFQGSDGQERLVGPGDPIDLMDLWSKHVDPFNGDDDDFTD